MKLNPFAPVPFDHPWHEWTRVPSLGREMHSWTWNAAPQPAGAAPLVLVPAIGDAGRWRKALGRRLGEHFRVIAPDLPGFHRGPLDVLTHRGVIADVREHADHLLQWMDARRLERVVLCGHASGCEVILDLASRCPDRIDRMVLIAPTVSVPSALSMKATVIDAPHLSRSAEVTRTAETIESLLGATVPSRQTAAKASESQTQTAQPWWPAAAGNH